MTSLKEKSEKRFLEKIEKRDACWIWKASIDRHGYGQFHFNKKTMLAHRFSYENFIGEIPKGLPLDHLCKVTQCVNPKHLEPVTCKENSRRSDAGKKTGAKQRSKTHCPYGHPYDEKNTYMDNPNHRSCRTCRKRRMVEYQIRKKSLDDLLKGKE